MRITLLQCRDCRSGRAQEDTKGCLLAARALRAGIFSQPQRQLFAGAVVLVDLSILNQDPGSRCVSTSYSDGTRLQAQEIAGLLDLPSDFSKWRSYGLANDMQKVGHVVTAKLPNDLVSRLDEIAVRIDRSKSWIVREALTEWLLIEQRGFEVGQEALKNVDEGRTIPHEELLPAVEKRKRERRERESHRKAARRNKEFKNRAASA